MTAQIRAISRKYQRLPQGPLPAEFASDAVLVDDVRMSLGAEWGEEPLGVYALEYIFRNPDPALGLAVFVSCCWLDMQARYQLTWSAQLAETCLWLEGRGRMPRENFDSTARHLRAVRRVMDEPGGVAGWFAASAGKIASCNAAGAHGNLYRFAGGLAIDLFGAGSGTAGGVERLRRGEIPDGFSGGSYKRLWMLIRFLRRDRSLVRCLFERALETQPGGARALKAWYDDERFDPRDCELPVDARVKGRWNRLFGTALNEREVALDARRKARDLGFAPAALETILNF
jgi:hypothetical protein